MSRSYKKTGASSICSSHTDKSDRNICHRAERRKAKILLNEEIKFGIEKPFTYDKDICTLYIDSQLFNDYEKLGINPKTKTLLFSDSLNFDKAATLFAVFNDRINVAFGIGTYITCNTNVKHMNQVLKIVKVNGKDVAKLSDTPGKTMCLDSNYVEYLQRSIDWILSH